MKPIFPLKVTMKIPFLLFIVFDLLPAEAKPDLLLRGVQNDFLIDDIHIDSSDGMTRMLEPCKPDSSKCAGGFWYAMFFFS